MKVLAIVILFASTVAASAEWLDVPSGADIRLYDAVIDLDNATARMLFEVPEISAEAGRLGFADVEADFPYLCENIILPELRENGFQPEIVVISMADREVEFGILTPEATQFFEQFRIENDLCIWEGF